MSSTSKYCPILDRRVKIKSECEEKTKSITHDVPICQNDKNVCVGNCKGCSLI